MKGKNVKDDASLVAPIIPNSADGVLSIYDINAGVQCEVPLWSDPAATDLVTLFWGSLELQEFLSDPTKPLIYNIEKSFPPEALADGSYDVYYTVFDGLNTSTSATTSFIINAHLTPGTLTAPDILDADDDGAINYIEASDGVDVHVSYDSMAIGDAITLNLQGFDSSTNVMKEDYSSAATVVTAANVTDGFVDFVIPYDGVMENIGENAYAKCWYNVTLADSTKLSSEITQVRVDVIPPHK